VRTAVDTNVISALWSLEPTASTIIQLLRQSRSAGSLVVCGAVYVELRAHPKANERFVDDFLARTDVQVDFDLEPSIWQEIARGFSNYAKRRRSNSGQAKRLLGDYIVGAHALHRADRLLTLDTSRYKADFPKLRLLDTSSVS
jgi:predicted nucleic acid-binding protein